MNKVLSFFLAVIAFFSGLFTGGKEQKSFKNEYTIPEKTVPYTRLDTTPKTDWRAEYIWDSSDGSEENVWMCFRKTFELEEKPDSLKAYIAADSKYRLYVNGENAVFEGGVKRGPAKKGSYFDCVDISSYLKKGKNVIAALVWYWGKDKNYSYTDSGKGWFLFEAGDIISDNTWKVKRHPAYKNDKPASKPNYRLPEFSIYYDAREETGDLFSPEYDDSLWENAAITEKDGALNRDGLYPRGIPMLKDYGLKDYENSAEYKGLTTKSRRLITLKIPYNAQCTPYFKIEAEEGKKIRIFTENTWLGAVSDTYITKKGEQEFEFPGWFNGEKITYVIPKGVKILELKYRETGYNTEFSGLFECGDERLNTLWQKSLRTLYVTMRDNFMDCPDRERAQWWGDVTNEMALSTYALDCNSYLLYQKGVASMLGHRDPETAVLETVIPIGGESFELPVQQLAGICGFWTYYLYTGDEAFLKQVYNASVNYVKLWTVGENNLVIHRKGTWDWMDWGSKADKTAIENAWYYGALKAIRDMAKVIGRDTAETEKTMAVIESGYEALWTEKGYTSGKKPDDRANALAVISGLADESKYDVITSVLTETKNSSPYMEYYVLEALCLMGRYGEAKERILERYDGMIKEDCSTLWEKWSKYGGTRNHAWSGGPLVIMSKYIAGIRPVKPGYEEYVIKPQIYEPDTIKCVVPSVKGYIKMTAGKTEKGFTLDAEIPKDSKAIIYIPCSDGQAVKLNGKTVYENGRFKGAEDTEFIKEEEGFAVFSVKPAENMTLHFEAE